MAMTETMPSNTEAVPVVPVQVGRGTTFDNVHPALRNCWHPVALSTEITNVPYPFVLMGDAWVAVRLGDRLTVLADRCPHRHVPLSTGKVVGNTLQCQYHGYRFDADGHCIEIPAQEPSTAIGKYAHCGTPARVAELYGIAWIAVDEPTTPLPDVPEHGTEGFASVLVDPQTWRVGAAQMADNFLDVGHFPYLHANSFGDPDDLRVRDYDVVTTGDWTFEAWHRNTTKPLNEAVDESITAETEFSIVERTMHYIFTAPYTVYLRIDYAGVALVLGFFMMPVDADHTRLFVLNVRDDIPKGLATPDESRALSEVVIAEDRWMLESLPTRATFIDLTSEYHSRADRITVEMRRVLARLASTAT